MTASNTVTVTINNQAITADMATLAALLSMAVEMSMHSTPKSTAKSKAKSEKPADKAHEIRSKHDAVLDSKRVKRMVQTAITSAAKQGFEVKESKQGKWMWLYPCGKSTGKGRTAEFKSMKLAKGWSHSMKRGAFYRDFS